MKNILIALTGVTMIAYVLYRSFTTLVILPFVSSRDSFTGVLSILLVLLAAGAIVLSFTRRKAMAASLATIVGAVALGSWFFVICTAPVWTRSYFVWFVVPEVAFRSRGSLTGWSNVLEVSAHRRRSRFGRMTGNPEITAEPVVSAVSNQALSRYDYLTPGETGT